MNLRFLAALALVLGQPVAPSQFEAASVKVDPGGIATTRRIEPDSLTYFNLTLGEFVQIAHGVERYQIQGDDWITNTESRDRYDIVAKAAMPVGETELRRMLARVLEERFHLKTHRETRMVPVYVLVQATGGAKLQPGDGGLQTVNPDPVGGFRFQNYSIAAFVNTLSAIPAVGRPVIDDTGLAGRYSFTTNPHNLPAGANVFKAKQALLQSDATMFAALEELGLKLMPERRSLDIIIIDSADRVPSAD